MAESQSISIRPFSSIFVAATSSAIAFWIVGGLVLGLAGLNRNAVAWSLLGAGTFLILVLSVVRVRCVVSDEGVLVVNLWRTHDIRWTRFGGIEQAQGWLGAAFFLSLFSPIRIRTTDGRKVIVQASLVDDGRVTSVVEARQPRRRGS